VDKLDELYLEKLFEVYYKFSFIDEKYNYVKIILTEKAIKAMIRIIFIKNSTEEKNINLTDIKEIYSQKFISKLLYLNFVEVINDRNNNCLKENKFFELIKLFSKEILNCDIEKYLDKFITKIKTRYFEVPEINNIRALNLYNILEMKWNLNDFMDEWIKIDFDSIEDITPDYIGEREQWIPIILLHSDTWRVLVDKSNKIIGYWHMTSVDEEYYEKLKNGIILDGEVNIDMISLMIPGRHKIYFIGICLLDEYKKTRAIKLILDSLFKSFESMAKDYIFIDEMCTLAYSKNGIKLSEGMGFSFFKDLDSNGIIYKATISDLLKKSYSRRYKGLKSYYLG
jgi:hypothetical protein